jgi:hemoglobin/transferrin/lactoferrin receptor protein
MSNDQSLFRCAISVAASCLVVLTPAWMFAQGSASEIRGRVRDETGGAIVGAQLVLHTTHGAAIQETRSVSDGTFSLGVAPPGSYWLEVTAEQFDSRRLPIDLSAQPIPPLEIFLGLDSFRSEITVTSERGTLVDIRETAPIVTVRDDVRRHPLPTIGHALTGVAGVMVQQSTTGQVSPFLRGLTGYQVLNLIDGVRFNNSTFRSGPNQYLAFVDPSQVHQLEAVLGPSSSQFGSDAMGGAIQLLTPIPQFIDGSGIRPMGSLNVFGAIADQSGGGDIAAGIRGARTFLSGGAAWRESNDVRAGGGRDSHHVLRRLFALSDDQIRDLVGSRQSGTGFSHSAFHAKLAVRAGRDQNLTVWHQASEMEDVRGYKDLWGGLGRVRSDFAPQRLRLSYARYETLGAPGLDSLSATVSINSQTDGSIRQGLKLTDAVTTDDVRVDAYGYALQATTHVTQRNDLAFGGEIYDEHVDARRTVANPQTGSIEFRRALYPNGSTYRIAGIFAQDAFDLIPSKLRAVAGARFTHVHVETFAKRNTTGDGRDLGVADSNETFKDWTYNVALTWKATDVLSVHMLSGRGFRAPNLNDLGALGLNDLGYEVPSSAVLDSKAFIGASDGEGVLSTGRPVSRLNAERLFNTEIGVSFRWRNLYARAHVFNSELKDPIVRRTLVFPLAELPVTFAGLQLSPVPPTAAQVEQGVGHVATAYDPRAVKAFVNDGAARHRGVDTSFEYRIGSRWSFEGSYSYLTGHDLNPTRPVRRLPPQQGFLSARYLTTGRLSWIEVSAHVSGAQTELSGGDITDERIGAARRRSDITDFFSGSLTGSYIGPGSDGRFGSPDDVFMPTGETVAQIRDRVLPLGATINGVAVVNDATRVPLVTETPGFLCVNLGAGVALAQKIRLDLALMNVLDSNYRIHGSGVDAPGISLFARLNLNLW